MSSASASPHHSGMPSASQTSWLAPWWSGCAWVSAWALTARPRNWRRIRRPARRVAASISTSPARYTLIALGGRPRSCHRPSASCFIGGGPSSGASVPGALQAPHALDALLPGRLALVGPLADELEAGRGGDAAAREIGPVVMDLDALDGLVIEGLGAQAAHRLGRDAP